MFDSNILYMRGVLLAMRKAYSLEILDQVFNEAWELADDGQKLKISHEYERRKNEILNPGEFK